MDHAEEEVLQSNAAGAVEAVDYPGTEETEQPSRTVFTSTGPIPQVMGDETGHLGGIVSCNTRSASENAFGPYVVDAKTKQRP